MDKYHAVVHRDDCFVQAEDKGKKVKVLPITGYKANDGR
jgi:hypothetical protein